MYNYVAQYTILACVYGNTTQIISQSRVITDENIPGKITILHEAYFGDIV